MKVCMSGRQSRGLALVSVMALVLLGALSGCRKQPLTPVGRPTIPACNQKPIIITPGDATHAPSVDIKVCTIFPTETITWQCKGCKGWQVTFLDPSVDDRLLFEHGAVRFGDTEGAGIGQASATLVSSPLLSNGPIVVKYTVQTEGSPPYDPHIIPMGP